MAPPLPARACHIWLEYLQVARGLSPNTVAAYRRDAAQFFAGQKTLDTTPAVVEKWLSKLAADSPRSNARRLTALRQFFGYALEKGWLEHDPTALIRSPKLPQSLPKALSITEVNKLLAAPLGESPAEVRLRLILQLLYASGLRVSELVGLSVHDVTQSEGPWLRVVGKGSKTRQVPLGPVVQATLDAYLTHTRSRLRGAQGPWLLAGPSGKQPLTRVRIFQLIKAAGARVGIKVAPHHLRHTFATHLLEGEADLRAVQLMLGHASLNTTQIYTKLTTQRLKDTLDKHHPLATHRPATFGKKAKS